MGETLQVFSNRPNGGVLGKKKNSQLESDKAAQSDVSRRNWQSERIHSFNTEMILYPMFIHVWREHIKLSFALSNRMEGGFYCMTPFVKLYIKSKIHWQKSILPLSRWEKKTTINKSIIYFTVHNSHFTWINWSLVLEWMHWSIKHAGLWWKFEVEDE